LPYCEVVHVDHSVCICIGAGDRAPAESLRIFP
jgi:hypothetical protein